jgi:hypothetical protein
VPEKPCRNCGVTKPLDDFYRSRQASDGRQSWCKACMSIRTRNPAATRRHTAKWKRENPDKERAHQAIKRALRHGVVVRPDVCESCKERVEPHAHHDDYTKPLDVRWLCRGCHVAEHGQEKSNAA